MQRITKRGRLLLKSKRTLIGLVVLLLTVCYLTITVTVAQTSPKSSNNTGYSYTADHLSWGDVYSFDEAAYNGTNYSKLDGSSNSITYYNNSSNSNSGTGTTSLPKYVGTVKYESHKAPVSTAMNAHTKAHFRSNIGTGKVEAPIGNGVTIPVVTTTASTGIYSVVPASTGDYVVYVYSPSGTPSNVRYSVLKDYASANSYTGTQGNTALSFTAIGTTGWYYSSNINIANMGWTAYETSFSKNSDTSTKSDTGTGTFTGKTITTNASLGGSSTTYYYNKWGATEIKFDTVICLSFPTSVQLGPITEADGTFKITCDSSKGSVSVYNIFSEDVGTTYNGVHMPLFISATPAAGTEYEFTGVEGGAVETIGDDVYYRYDFEKSVSFQAKFEKPVNLPKVMVGGKTLDPYKSPDLTASFVNGVETEFEFEADFSEAVEGSTLTYTIDSDTGITPNSGTLTATDNTFSFIASFHTVTVTFTARGEEVEKTMTYTITGVNSGQPVARIGTTSGQNEYYFLEDALVASNTISGNIYLIGDYTMYTGSRKPTSWTTNNKGYTIKSGTTLVVPYSTDTTVHTTTPAYKYEAHATPYPYRTLTIPNGISLTVNGSVSVDSKVCTQGQNSTSWNGTPSGPHGLIVMRSGSHMTFKSNANLYCYGYINGDGTISMESGSNAYELFQLRCWRGGSATSSMNGNSRYVFPMSQYYVQNIEAPITFVYGAKEYIWTVVNMSSSAYKSNNPVFIGSGGMFQLESGASVTKRYNANVDRLEIEVDGNISVNSISISLTVTVNTSSYVLPLNNMEIIIKSGTSSINSSQSRGLAFLPSSKITVDEGATFKVNAPVYFYDNDDWYTKGYACDSQDVVPVGYSTANGTTAIRTAANLRDAEMDVNGTVEVPNKLYTTAGGANITSSKGTGVIKFTSDTATSSGTTYQATQSGTSISYHNITVNNAWLKNGDETYSKTVSTGQSTWKYDKNGEHWYRYTVDFKYNGNIISRGYYCENNDTVTYDASWLAELDASVTTGSGTAAVSGSNINVTNVTADSVVTLTGVPAEYKPTFVLNEKQYSIYQHYTKKTIENTTTIGDDTYYIVNQSDTALAVGTSYPAPTDENMGVIPDNHNTITWNLSGISATSGDPYRDTVPVGAQAQGPSYIYGFYTGYIVHNSWDNQYYDTLIGAFKEMPQDVTATITMIADCNTFEEEDSTITYTAYPAGNITLDLNGYHAVGRIASSGNFTLELNGGSLEYITNATAAAASYQKTAAVVNSGTMTIKDSVGGGVISCDATSSASGADGSAVIRNNAGATLTVTGKDSDHMLKILQNQKEVPYNKDYGYYPYNYGIFNLGTITALTDVEATTNLSRSAGISVYNYDTGVIELISGGRAFCCCNTGVYNYGGTIDHIDGLTIEGCNGLTNRNIVGGAIASGSTITKKGIINTVENCTFEVGLYAIYNHAVMDTLKNSTFVAHPDSAQVDTLGNGLETIAQNGNTYAYALFNSSNWWYNTNVWKRTDVTSGKYERTEEFKEDENCRPTINHIINCTIKGENTGTSTDHGRAFYNAGIIGEINGGTIQTYKHPSNTKVSTSNYALYQEAGGIIKSITGELNVSATGYSAVHSTSQFTKKTVNTYNDKIGGIQTHNVTTYGQPSEITSITASGKWSVGSYYALYNGGYIETINTPGLTLTGSTSLLVNTGAANKDYEFIRTYTTPGTSSSESNRLEKYTKNTEKGGYIGTVNGITLTATNYYALQNQGYIGTLSNVTASNTSANNTPTVWNGDSRWTKYQLDRPTNVTGDEYVPADHFTIQSGVVTLYHYTYEAENGICPTIDVIDNLNVNSNGQYAFQNCGHIGTMKNSEFFTNSNYAFHNSAAGYYTSRDTLRYYSGASIFTTNKNNGGDIVPHYTRGYSTVDTIDNCTFKTKSSTYPAKNVGHLGTIKNSTFIAGETTATDSALYNAESIELEYTDNYGSTLYFVVNGATSFTQYKSTAGESRVIDYDYDIPVIDLIAEGNTFKATKYAIHNKGKINEINSGTGAKTKILATGKNESGNYAFYSYDGTLDTRTSNTPYTAAATVNANGTAGSVSYSNTAYHKAYIGTIKNVYMESNSNVLYNGSNGGSSTSAYNPSIIHEIGEGAEFYGKGDFTTVYDKTYTGFIETITGGIFTASKSGTNYAFKNDSTNTTVISGGHFKGGNGTRDTAVAYLTTPGRESFPEGKKLSTVTKDVQLYNGTSVVTGTGYYFINDVYTVTFDMQGHGTAPADQSIESGLKATKPSTDPTATGWTFGGWYKESDCTNKWDFTADTVTEDTTIYAKWTENSYTVTWKNYNGISSSSTTSPYGYGQNPSYSGTPSKASTVDTTYTFSGWNDGTKTYGPTETLPAVTGDVTYTAQFTPSTRQYAITWKNDNGNVIDTTYVDYGTKPTHAPASKDNTAQYTYTFTGWTPTIETVTEDAIYTAVYSSVVNKYTIIWKNDDTVLETDENVEYGKTPEYNGATPTKTATTQYTYTFSGWSPSVSTVKGDKTYTALFSQTTNKYTITWLNGDGTELKHEDVAYGTTPSYSGTAPSKAKSEEFEYVFSKWSPDIVSVDGPATYTAQFTAKVPEDPNKATDAQYTYTFSGWSTDGGETVDEDIKAGDTVTVTGGETYTAVYEEQVNQYYVTWLDEDGNPLQSQPEVCAYDDTPEAPPTPTKPDTPRYRYEFAGWEYHVDEFDVSQIVGTVAVSSGAKGKKVASTGDGEATIVTEAQPVEGQTTYTAKFNEIEKTFTVTWLDDDGTTKLKADDTEVAYDTVLVYSGTEPSKPKTAEYTYTFTGWSYSYTPFNNDPSVQVQPVTGTISKGGTFLNVTADITYTAVYSSTKNKYTITWLNYDDSQITTTSVEYGKVPSCSNHTRSSTAQYYYTFAGWSPAPTAVTGPATYKATYTENIQKYTVYWRNYDGSKLETDSNVPYGTMPEYNGATPTRAADGANTYTFAGWDKEITTVSGTTYYNATYTATPIDYTITWIDYDNETVLETDYVHYGDTPSFDGELTPPEDAEDTYTLKWFDGNKAYTPDKLPTVTASAVYIATYYYNVSFTTTDSQGNQAVVSKEYVYGTDLNKGLTNPGNYTTVENERLETYAFVGWSDGVNDYEIGASLPYLNDNLAYTARYEKVFQGHSLALEDSIDTNFYIMVPHGYDPADLTVDFTWGEGLSYEAAPAANSGRKEIVATGADCDLETITATGADQVFTYTGCALTASNNGLWKATVPIAAKEMNDIIYVELKDEDENVVAEGTYKATDYMYLAIDTDTAELAQKIEGTTQNASDLKELCKSTLAYGAAAQRYFGYNTEDLADKDLVTDDPTDARYYNPDYSTVSEATFESYYAGDYLAMANTNLKETDIKYYGTSLSLESETEYNLFFNRLYSYDVNNPVVAQISGEAIEKRDVEGVLVDSNENSGDQAFVRIDIKGIAAADLMKDIIIKLPKQQAFTLNVGTYMYVAMYYANTYTDDPTIQNLGKVVQTLYLYSGKAETYFSGMND